MSDDADSNWMNIGGEMISRFTEKQITPIKYTTIPRESHRVITIVNPNMINGPWIAGGAPLHWYTERKLEGSDIDVFCASTEQAEQIIKRLTEDYNYAQVISTDNAVTMRNPDDVNEIIQVIICNFFKTAKEVMRNFDISVCQIVTDGFTFVVGPRTIQDINKNRLRFIMPYRNASFSRYVKYMAYGYVPAEDELASILNAIDLNNVDPQGSYNEI